VPDLHPRERYNTTVREQLQGLLMGAFGGTDSEFQAQVSESLLARILVIVRTPGGIPGDVEIETIENEIKELAQTWPDRVHAALIEANGEEEGNRLFRSFGQAFPVAYHERVTPRAAVPDIHVLDRLQRESDESLGMSLYRKLEDRPEIVRFKLIRPTCRSTSPTPCRSWRTWGSGSSTRNHTASAPPKVPSLRCTISPCASPTAMPSTSMPAAMPSRRPSSGPGRAPSENDGFNRLVLAAGLDAADIVVLRAYCKYILQLGSPFSQSYIEEHLHLEHHPRGRPGGALQQPLRSGLRRRSRDRDRRPEKRIEAGLEARSPSSTRTASCAAISA
jgi:glutamate dehydrogenase